MDSKIKVIAPGAREKMVLWMATRGGSCSVAQR
jgi:hypothetical protein